MNVGTAEGTFDLKGLKKSIRELKQVKTELGKLDRSVTNHIQNNKKFVAALKKRSSMHAKVLKNAKGTRQAHMAVARSIKERVKVLRQLRVMQAKMTAGSIKRGIGKMFTVSPGQANAFKSVRESFGKFTTSLKNNNAGMKTWWSRFGGVAAGFWIAYRAINAVEFAISSLTRTFVSGVKMIDEYRQSVATVAGMLALINNKTGSFSSQFERFQGVMQQTMRESIRLAPKYRLSIDEIGNAYKELSQFGVIVQRQQVDNTLNSIAMIREIAATTGSTARQVRQEIQSLFTGTTRVTDQFGRMIKQSMPQLHKAIFDVAGANATNAEKWQLVIKRMSAFDAAVQSINNSVGAQVEIIKKNTQIISSFAVETSGVYQEWVDKIKEFNAELFNTDGTFGPLGVKVYRAFYRVWEILNKIIKSIKVIWTLITDLAGIIFEFSKPFKAFITIMGKWALSVMAVKFAYSTLLGVVTTLWKLLAGGIILTSLKLFFKVLIVGFSTLAAPLALVAAHILGLAAAFLLGIRVGREFYAVFKGAVEGILTLAAPLSTLFTSIGKQMDAILFNFAEWRKNILHPWDAQRIEIPSLDFSGFIDVGKNASNAFWKGYTEGNKQFDEGLDVILTSVKDKVTNFYTKIKGLVTSPSVTTALIAFKDEMAELLKFSDIKMPDFSAWAGNLDASVDKGLSALQRMFDKLKEMSEYISSEFKSVFSELFAGEIDNLKDFWDASLNAMVKSFEKAMADLTSAYFDLFLKETFLKQNIIGVGQTLGGLFSPATPTTGLGTVHEEFANGGVITEPVFGIGTSGKTYSIAEKGPERVLSNADSFTQPQASANVSVIIQNNSSAKITQEQKQPKFDGKQAIIEVVLNDYNEGGDIYKTLNRG